MIHAYDELYLGDARRNLAGSFDHAVIAMGYELPDYYRLFMGTDIARRFENGDPFIISGMSGIEMARRVISRISPEKADLPPVYHDDRGSGYWAGWAIAYYQWYSGCSFKRLDEEVSIEQIEGMYSKYHEMDITHFVDRIDEIRMTSRVNSYLKKYREQKGYSQSELASLTGIPVRTLQQYEQGQKRLSRARADYVLSLASVLGVEPKILIEYT